MSLESRIRVDGQYTRAVSLERDVDGGRGDALYIPTSRALQTLYRVAPALGEEAIPRAWALVGPYGSGKSAFGVFLANLLSRDGPLSHRTAVDRLKSRDADLAAKFVNPDSGASGFCPVVLTGSPEPLSRRLLAALSNAAAAFWADRRKPTIVSRLRKRSLSNEPVDSSVLLEALDNLARAVIRAGGSGLVILVDELGKFLEYESRHYGANDIYLLQAIAERTCRGGPERILLVTMLHQSIELYARGLGEKQRQEWLKVQGRFELLPFIDSSEQVLRVVDSAFDVSLSSRDKTSIRKALRPIIEKLSEEGALPDGLSTSSAVQLFLGCYPLHPMTALLLPMLCQRIAQNERTLFSFLGSREPGGFRDAASKLTEVGQFIGPWDVYDYFIENQAAAIADPSTQRRWVEVVTSLERLADAPPDEIKLFKAIGILNIAGAQARFKASRALLSTCFDSLDTVDGILEALKTKSAVQFRRFSGEWRVWQGSDFDLGSALEDAREQLGEFSLSAAINTRRTFAPIVARRHSIERGTLRYFEPILTSRSDWKDSRIDAGAPQVVFFLGESADDLQFFKESVRRNVRAMDVAIFHGNGGELREVVREVLALERVQSGHQELLSDPVAQREVRERLAEYSRRETLLVEAFLDSPKDATWSWRNEEIAVDTRRDAQRELSRIMDETYYLSPVIRNELINRDKLSSQAAAARNKLLAALLASSDRADLGFEKFPPEKAIYRSLLLATNLHKQSSDGWELCAPHEGTDVHNLVPAWTAIAEYMLTATDAPKDFAELDTMLAAPPYGIKEGILPILYACVLRVQDRDTALFEDGRYVPRITSEHMERFVRRRSDFSVQSFQIEGTRAALFSEYARLFHQEHATTVVELVRPLAQSLSRLPECARATLQVSLVAQKVRTAFLAAKSPESLLFEHLPRACGLELGQEALPDEIALVRYSEEFGSALHELESYYERLLLEYSAKICEVFGLQVPDDLGLLRRQVESCCTDLHEYTQDEDGLRAWLLRLCDPRPDDNEWIRGALTFLGRKPVERWLDRDRGAVDLRLAEFARRVPELQMLRAGNLARRSDLAAGDEIYLLRSLSKSRNARSEVAVVTRDIRELVQEIANDAIQQIRNRALIDEHRVAVLALVAEALLKPEPSSPDNSRNSPTDRVNSRNED